MKKIILLLTITFILFSCSEVQENKEAQVNMGVLQNTVIVQTGSLVDSNAGVIQEDAAEILLKDELIEITHNNFKPFIDSLKIMDNEGLKNIDCANYIYFPEIEKRPDYQVEIYNDYLKQCGKIIENTKK
ncbi:MAG: hypothetical protein PHH98_04760 [Candidatus Gracilibacteria bacterium]|nr:hypothetical protein [Candidatus Gracilibacteria bacterium]